MSKRTIGELESAFKQLHERLLRGEMDEGDFQAEVEQLGFKDDQGRQWKIGWYTGNWYRSDQGWWSEDTPAEPEAVQPSPAAQAAWVTGDQPRQRITPWLVAPLVILLLLASILLVSGWGGSPALITQVIATQTSSPPPPSASPTTEPTQAPPSPTVPPPSATSGSTATRALSTAGQTPTLASAQVPATPVPATPIPASASATAGTSAATETPLPATDTPTANPTASPAPSRTRPPSPSATPKPERASPAGRIFFPVYDPQPARRTFDIYAVRLDSGRREPVAGQASQPAISPDGQRLAYRSWVTGQQGLFVLEFADGHTWRWVDAAEAARPSWSPNGQNLVFPSQHEADQGWRIYRTEGRGFVQMRRGGSDISGRVPTWLSDGRIIYWDCPGNSCGLYVMGGDGTAPVRLTTAEHDTSPAASPDGGQIAFMSNQGGNWDIYLINSRAPLGTAPTRMTRDPARDGLPAWSPDGQWLAFVSERGGAWGVWAMRPDGSDLQRLFGLGGPLDGKVVYAQAGEQAGWTSETIAWGP